MGSSQIYSARTNDEISPHAYTQTQNDAIALTAMGREFRDKTVTTLECQCHELS